MERAEILEALSCALDRKSRTCQWLVTQGFYHATRDSSDPGLAFDLMPLHPEVVALCRKPFQDGHYAHAVIEAAKLVNNCVKKRAGYPKKQGGQDYDGADLMTRVFSKDNPILKCNSLRSTSDRDEQIGYMKLFEGLVIGVRNPRAHEHGYEDDPWYALQILTMASHLLSRLDRAIRTRKRRARSSGTR